MVKLCRSIFLAILIWSPCPSFGLYDGTSPPMGVIAAFNLIAGPKELLPLHSDHGGPGQEPRNVRREEWLSALVKGEPVTLKM